jgi:hypothetical protein
MASSTTTSMPASREGSNPALRTDAAGDCAPTTGRTETATAAEARHTASVKARMTLE